tara:strand:- start:354 stop:1067 length:714 start_codon:yes stop_codon:yes gene_type:complete
MSGALPKLNATPTHELTIPSSGQKVSYRPYLVKEEKILLLAFESKDEKQAMQAMVDTIVACVNEKLNPKTFTSFDVEYMFTQIRSKSVGETTKINVACSECKTMNEQTINLAELKVEVPEVNNVIELTDNISVELKYPSFEAFIKNYGKDQTETEFSYMVVNNCISAVINGETRISADEVSVKEITEFVESMNSKQFQSIADYVQSMPQLEDTVNFTCSNCGHENERNLKGISDFFS